MESLIRALGKASSSNALEKALDGATLETMAASTREERDRMKQMLEDLSANKSELLDSAKLRRRVRRLLGTLDVKIEAKAAAFAAAAVASEKVTTTRTAKDVAACPLGMVDAIDALRGARKPFELEAVLNNLRLPAKVDGHHNDEFLSNRDHLRETLDHLSNDMSLTTAVLRKRIKKLRYGLLPEPLKQQVKNSVRVVKKNLLPQAKNTTTTTTNNNNSNTVCGYNKDSTPMTSSSVAPHKSADIVLAELQAAKTGEAVDLALSGFAEVSLTAAGVAETAIKLSVALGALLEPGHVCGELNAKVRRKVRRGLDLLAKVSTPVAVHVAAPAMNRQRVSSLAADVAASTAKPVASVSLQGVHSAFQTALHHSSLLDIEAALALVADISPAEACHADALITLLVGLAKNGIATTGTEGLTFNSALRRRITRAADSLTLKAAAAVSLFSSTSSTLPLSTVIIHNPPPGRDLTPTIAAVGAARDNAALMSALSDVSRGDGNVTTRRKLVRLLGQLERQGELSNCAVQLTDKTRALCLLVIHLLQPVSNSGAKVVSTDEVAHRDLLSGPVTRTSMQGASSKPPTPYVIFVGQLPFDCTTADLDALLQTAELGRPAKVRFLTNESTGAFRGTAFVEVESAEDQHKCLSLHHSIVRGRKINIEKSCGGSNPERRAGKLAEQRRSQQAVLHQKIVLIVDQYSARGVLPPREQLGSVVQERLFAYSPAHVQAVLSNYEKAISSSNQAAGFSSATSQAALDRTMDSFDRKLLRTAGSAVPNSKRMRNYGGRDEGGDDSSPESSIKRVKE